MRKALDKQRIYDIIIFVTICEKSERLLMKIDLTPMLGGETCEISFDYPLTVEEEFPGCTFPKPVRVLGTIINKAGYIALTAEITVEYDTVCDRCLKPIRKTLRIDYQKPVATKGSLQKEDGADYLIAVDRMLDLDEPIIEAIILEFPMKNLCKEGCKGLCFQCGADLNEGDCACTKKEIDPRMAAFAKLLEK